VKYQFIKDNSRLYPTSLLCKVLDIKRAGYYHWQKRKAVARATSDLLILKEIRKYFKKSEETYGVRRIHHSFRRNGKKINIKRVYRIMRKYGIYSKTKKKFKVTTKHGANGIYSENLLKGKFKSSRQNEIWTSDITYVWTKEGWLYLAVVMDIFTRKIIGWSLSTRINSAIVKDALAMAIRHEKPGDGVIFHSDRGSQYCSKIVRDLLSENDFLQSMSSTRNCYDNAITETFFATLKKELVYLTKFETREKARGEIFRYIEIFYNRKRQHSALGYLSPYEFEMKNLNENKKEEIENKKELINNINKQRVAYLCV
jgi:putative transposase